MLNKGKIIVLVFVGLLLVSLLVPTALYYVFIDPKVEFINKTSKFVKLFVREGIGSRSVTVSPYSKYNFRPNGDHSFGTTVLIKSEEVNCVSKILSCCQMEGVICLSKDKIFSKYGMEIFFSELSSNQYKIDVQKPN